MLVILFQTSNLFLLLQFLQLALRFKTAEIKETFVKTVERAQDGEKEGKVAAKSQYIEAQKGFVLTFL